MHISPKTKVIVGVLGALIVIGLVYVEFFSNNSGSGVTASGTASPETQTFLDLTSQLGPISFDTSILNDQRFTSLVDIHTAIIPEQTGRRNPFSSFGGSSSASSTSQ